MLTNRQTHPLLLLGWLAPLLLLLLLWLDCSPCLRPILLLLLRLLLLGEHTLAPLCLLWHCLTPLSLLVLLLLVTVLQGVPVRLLLLAPLLLLLC
jgi:hypothetical protein